MTRVRVWIAAPVGDQREHARAVLRQAAAEVLGVPAEDLHTRREPGGRPLLALRHRRDDRMAQAVARAGVSVSHTRGLTAVAVTTDGRVGVDVEAVRELPAVALARRWLAEDEVRWIAAQDAAWRSRALLWVWTHKEALGKVRGTGLARGGRAQPVPLPDTVERSVTGVLRAVPGGAGLTCAAPPAPEGYQLCVAADRGTAGVSVSVRVLAG